MPNQLSEDRPTVRAHKRQFAWQILAPFLLMTMLVIAGALLVTTGGTARTSVWADVSMIWLMIPALLFAFALLVVIITIIYGMIKILPIIPHYTGKAQDIFNRIANGTRKVADGTTKPFIWYKQAGAVIKSILRR
jgi:predicted membrane protein